MSLRGSGWGPIAIVAVNLAAFLVRSARPLLVGFFSSLTLSWLKAAGSAGSYRRQDLAGLRA